MCVIINVNNRNMPSKKQYDLVQNDDYDTRIPLHPDEAFHHGIIFNAKYIGMLDVPRPTSRVEIVSAMRKIRYEFKANGVKKKKVTIEVSVDGVKVTPKKKKKRKQWPEEKSVLLSNPIYRIFYVSHDSQDLKIFSYIARDGNSSGFKCAVFKSNKKSQAMRVVRTIGQAFEVCHKLSITAPDPDPPDPDEQDTLTQDLVSDHISDVISDKPKKDMLSETASDRNSLQQEDHQLFDEFSPDMPKNIKPSTLDFALYMNNPKKNAQQLPGESYMSPNTESFMTGGSGSGSGGNATTVSVGSTLSAQHEIQLLKEQLQQQHQQTQATMGQLQLVREQLAAEQSARMEAQARTHQLLVHNKELLDHIAALVSHLQGDKGSAQSQPPHVAMPQQQQNQGMVDGYGSEEQNQAIQHSMGLQSQGLIENRMATACLPPSPLRNTFNPTGTVFNFPYPQPAPPPQDHSFETQLLQRLQAVSGYTPPYPYNYQAYLPNLYSPPLVNNHYPLQSPPQKKFQASPLAMRQTYTGSPVLERHASPARNLYPDSTMVQSSQNLPPQQRLVPHSLSTQQKSPKLDKNSNLNSQYIKPLSQMGTLTTTDTHGRVRVIVPVPSRSPDDDAGNLLASLRLGDDLRPAITRSTSEKVPNRSELMSQVQRTAWARHTTK